jgi:hypothetical protein
MSHLQESLGWEFPMKLRDLLEQLNDNPKDVDLYHWNIDGESATMVDLSLNDFTEDGLKEFKVALRTITTSGLQLTKNKGCRHGKTGYNQ